MTDISEYQELMDKYGKHKVAEEWAKENFRHNPEGENGGWEYEDYVVPAHLAGQECGEQRAASGRGDRAVAACDLRLADSPTGGSTGAHRARRVEGGNQVRCNRCFLNEAANSIGLCGACANLTCDPMDKTLTDTRRAEVEALAEKLFIAMWADYPLTQQCDGSFPDDWDVAAWSFNGAEAWLAERDRRREEAP